MAKRIISIFLAVVLLLAAALIFCFVVNHGLRIIRDAYNICFVYYIGDAHALMHHGGLDIHNIQGGYHQEDYYQNLYAVNENLNIYEQDSRIVIQKVHYNNWIAEGHGFSKFFSAVSNSDSFYLKSTTLCIIAHLLWSFSSLVVKIALVGALFSLAVFLITGGDGKVWKIIRKVFAIASALWFVNLSLAHVLKILVKLSTLIRAVVSAFDPQIYGGSFLDFLEGTIIFLMSPRLIGIFVLALLVVFFLSVAAFIVAYTFMKNIKNTEEQKKKQIEKLNKRLAKLQTYENKKEEQDAIAKTV